MPPKMPLVSETTSLEIHVQKEILETLCNPFLFDPDSLPLFHCLQDCYEDMGDCGGVREAVFNVFPLWSLANQADRDERIRAALRAEFPTLDWRGYTRLNDWAYDNQKAWIKDVGPDSPPDDLLAYSIASAVRTEIDAYVATSNSLIGLELKLTSDFGSTGLIYQPWRQLFELWLLGLLYGVPRQQLYLVTMEDDQTVLQRVQARRPAFLPRGRDEDVRTLSWRTIRDWIASEGRQQFPPLARVEERLGYYLEAFDKSSASEAKKPVQAPRAEALISAEAETARRPTKDGFILSVNGTDVVWYYRSTPEVDVAFPKLDESVRLQWLPRFEEAGFRPVPSRAYWKLRTHYEEVEQLIEGLLADQG